MIAAGEAFRISIAAAKEEIVKVSPMARRSRRSRKHADDIKPSSRRHYTIFRADHGQQGKTVITPHRARPEGSRTREMDYLVEA